MGVILGNTRDDPDPKNIYKSKNVSKIAKEKTWSRLSNQQIEFREHSILSACGSQSALSTKDWYSDGLQWGEEVAVAGEGPEAGVAQVFQSVEGFAQAFAGGQDLRRKFGGAFVQILDGVGLRDGFF